LDSPWLAADEDKEFDFFGSGTLSKYIRFGWKPGTSVSQTPTNQDTRIKLNKQVSIFVLMFMLSLNISPELKPH
jgi:hypothetical protein